MTHLRCSVSHCGTTLYLHDRALACPKCGNLLEVAIGARKIDVRELERRTANDARDVSGVWRFREFLPDGYGPGGVVTLGEGNVPLVRGQKTAAWSGLNRLWFKHLGWNPT